MTNSILLVGVGGQGTILASKLLTIGLMEAGYSVKMSEIHGMSQRGGSVSTHVRYSKDAVYSPVIEEGEADMIVAFEKMEALRYMDYLKVGGKVVANDFKIESMVNLTGQADYEEAEIDKELNRLGAKLIKVNEIAKELGNEKVMNVILLGCLVKSMNLDNIDWESIIKANVKPKFIDINIEAFNKGLNLVG